MNTAIQKINTQLNTMSIDRTVLTKNKNIKFLLGLFVVFATLGASVRPVFATETAVDKLITKADGFVRSANKGLVKIATPIAGSCIAIALFIRMVSKNPRAVEEATVWAKRIFATYLVLVLSNFIFKSIKNLRTDVEDSDPEMWGGTLTPDK